MHEGIRAIVLSNLHHLTVIALLLGAVHVGFTAESISDNDATRTGLALVDKIRHPDLADVTSVAVSPDGRTLVAAAYPRGRVSFWTCDPTTGELAYTQTIGSPQLLGAVAFRWDPSGRFGITPAFRSESVTLFSFNSTESRFEIADQILNHTRGAEKLTFVVEAAFSAEGRFAYIGGAEAITIFRIVRDNKLSLVETFNARGINDTRGLAVSPDNQFLYAASAGSNALLVLERDPEIGTLATRQILLHGRMGIDGLRGVFSVACSGDGKHVYTSAGRFGGDNAVCAFLRTESDELTQIQILRGGNELQQFIGGNEILVTPDGQNVVALASVSDTIAYFQRDEETGKLTLLNEIKAGTAVNPGAAGVTFSPDGHWCYVADEKAGEIIVLSRR